MGQAPRAEWRRALDRRPRPFNLEGPRASVLGRTAGQTDRRQDAKPEPPPDLHTQLEAVLHQVWVEEERWRQEERIDLAVRLVSDT